MGALLPPRDWLDWTWQLKNRLTSAEHLEKHMTLTRGGKSRLRLRRQQARPGDHALFFQFDRPGRPELPDPPAGDSPGRRNGLQRGGDGGLAPRGRAFARAGPRAPLSGPRPLPRHRPLRRLTAAIAPGAGSVSNAQDYNFHPEYEQGLRYIEAHPEIRDVLLSGGDPLLLSDKKLEHLISRLRAIPHVEFIRIGSRIPVFLPQRVTPALCEIFKKYGPIWMSIHVNHPKECTAELKDACERLSFAGVPLGNQSVLLRGVNDDADIMKALVHRLLRMRVRPYYLYQMDLITGGSHFKVDVRKGIEIIRALRGNTTGYAVPQYVIDAPGGGGKVPMNPDYGGKRASLMTRWFSAIMRGRRFAIL